MKKSFLLITVWMLVCVVFSSCEDNRNQNMVSDRVYLVKTGLQMEESFDIGEKVVMQLWANKSGLNGTPCSVTFNMNTEALEQYNAENGASYKLLPTHCYSIPQSVFTISGDEQYAKWSMEYDPKEILAEAGGVYGETDFVFPVTISSDGVETTESNTVLLRFKVSEPMIRVMTGNFEMVRIFEGDDGQENLIEKKVEIGMSFTNRWDAVITLESDRTVLQSLVNDAKSSVVYTEKRLISTTSADTEEFRSVLTHIDGVLPPDDAYTLSTDMSVKKGANKMTVTCTIDPSKLYPGLNIIPVKLTGVTLPLQVDPAHDACYIAVQYVPDRSQVPIKSSSSHQTLNYSPKRIAGVFDGDFDTSWRPGVGAASYPSGIANDNNPAIVVDLGAETDVTAVEIWTRGPGERQGSRTEFYRTSPSPPNPLSYITNVKVYVSSDEQCWEAASGEFLVQGPAVITAAKGYWGEALVDYNWATDNPNSAPCTLTLPNSTRGRYVIVWYSKNANMADLWELFVYGNRM
ncbi:MAG: DUF1735 domain-containing protein [Bacteroidales bacterium]|nr:DUF1735 domain-containing protein [Bacteroidales bacterium]